MRWTSIRREFVGRMTWAAWALLALAGGAVLPACGKKLDCEAFSKKAKTCSVDLYLALSGPETRFIERMVAKGPGLDDAARLAMGRAWREERSQLAHRLVERLASKCKKDQGRYKQSEALQACLSKERCKDFAACCAKALGLDAPARSSAGGKSSGKAP